jgi:hypothetical protein
MITKKISLNSYFCFLLLLIIQSNVYSQTGVDSLVNMTNTQFEKWLFSHKSFNDSINDTIVNKVILDRFLKSKVISDQLLIFHTNESRTSPENKLLFIDSILVLSKFSPFIHLNLLGIKSGLLYLLDYPDSLKLNNYNNIEGIEMFINDATWIQYTNYVDKGNVLLKKSDDKIAAEGYFRKALTLQYYQYSSTQDIIRFRNIYVDAAVGLIKCNEGNYKELSQLIFAPSALHYICPTLNMYVKNSGGECEICKPYIKMSKH